MDILKESITNVVHSLKYMSEEARKQSFTTWTFDDDKNCNANAMAEAGFYFTGSRSEPDSAMCFFCDKALDGWEEDDDPWNEHINHSKTCDFANLRKRESQLTIDEYLDLHKKLFIKHLEKNRNNAIEKFKEPFDDLQKQIDKQMRKRQK